MSPRTGSSWSWTTCGSDQLLLEPHHELVGPFELAGPHGQAEQDQWDAARTRDGTADEAKGDKEETEEADSDAVDSQLASVLSDLATPAPAVLLRLDEDVVVVVLVWEVARLVRSRQLVAESRWEDQRRASRGRRRWMTWPPLVERQKVLRGAQISSRQSDSSPAPRRRAKDYARIARRGAEEE